MFFVQNQKRQNQLRKTESGLKLIFRGICFWDYQLQYGRKLNHLCPGEIKLKQFLNASGLEHILDQTTKNGIPGRLKVSLLKCINQFKETQVTNSFWTDILV